MKLSVSSQNVGLRSGRTTDELWMKLRDTAPLIAKVLYPRVTELRNEKRQFMTHSRPITFYFMTPSPFISPIVTNLASKSLQIFDSALR